MAAVGAGEAACTAQNGTSVAGVSFAYSGDENCILTDFNSTHATINDASYTQCVDGFSPSGWKS